jgi:single-stranded DNA-specific DHH superfamily exonuclease
MGRGKNNTLEASSLRSDSKEPIDGELNNSSANINEDNSKEINNLLSELDNYSMDLNKTFEEFNHLDKEPDWRVPNPFLLEEAQQFISPGMPGGIEGLDPAIATRLLKLSYDGDFYKYRHWYNGSGSLIKNPSKTCKGMTEAGAMLADVLDKGEKIAVYCDYDVDGTTAGEVFRRGLAPYNPDFHYGYADAQQGFGLTNDFVKQAADAGAKVLVTLDCGSSQVDQVQLAQNLGMKVVVVDHHTVEDNPAEFHLNPKLETPASSENTGAQLAWKLAAAVQIAEEGQMRKEHGEKALQLAGMGCLADMGSVVLPENRAFFWKAHQHVVPGVRLLAEQFEEDPERPGAMIRTQACMNLPKRTPLVDAADVGKLLAASTEAEAQPIVDKLLKEYEKAQPVKQEMTEKALEKIGRANWDHPQGVKRPQPKKYFASVVFDDYADYAGYTGPVASSISRAAAKPAVIFTKKGKDEHGQELYKFSTRNESGTNNKIQIGDMVEYPDIKEACTIKKRDESDQVVELPVVGGHSNVISGSCTKANLPKVIKAMESWAEEKDGKNKTGFWAQKWNGPDAFLSERQVSGQRLSTIEQQAAKLGPFARGKQLAAQPVAGRDVKLASNRPIEISVVGSLSELSPDPENINFLQGQLTLDNGQRREIRFPADIKEKPVGKMCEWILKINGDNRPYYLRKFFDPVTGEVH